MLSAARGMAYPGRVLDIRVRENTRFAQPVVVTLTGFVKDVKVELPPGQVP